MQRGVDPHIQHKLESRKEVETKIMRSHPEIDIEIHDNLEFITKMHPITDVGRLPNFDMMIEIHTLKRDLGLAVDHHTEQIVGKLETAIEDNRIEMDIDTMVIQIREDAAVSDVEK